MNESLKSTDYKKNNHVIIVQIQTKNNPKKRWTKTIMNEIWLKPKKKECWANRKQHGYALIQIFNNNQNDLPTNHFARSKSWRWEKHRFFFVSYCLVNILVRHFYYLYWINFIVAPKKKVMIMIMIDHHHYHHQNRI